MKKYIFIIVSIIIIFPMIFLLTSCFNNYVVMPYGTEEYVSGEWTEESLFIHLAELGFENIEISTVLERYGKDEWKLYSIKIEDPDSSWFTSYRTFNREEKFSKDSKIIIETSISHSTITVNNSEEFRQLICNPDISIEDPSILKFFESHNGEYIEFDGVVTHCFDTYFYIGSDIDFDIKIENSTWFKYSWDAVKLRFLNECGWHVNYNTYSVGTLDEGDNVHMICQIYSLGDYWTLDIKQFDTN